MSALNEPCPLRRQRRLRPPHVLLLCDALPHSILRGEVRQRLQLPQKRALPRACVAFARAVWAVPRTAKNQALRAMLAKRVFEA